jgi:hypothetical protein
MIALSQGMLQEAIEQAPPSITTEKVTRIWPVGFTHLGLFRSWSAIPVQLLRMDTAGIDYAKCRVGSLCNGGSLSRRCLAWYDDRG